jgi:hypothetical protein
MKDYGVGGTCSTRGGGEKIPKGRDNLEDVDIECILKK